MSGLGSYLSDLRLERGLSIDEVARLTRVAPRFIEALEKGDHAALPAPVFTRGYIRAFCQVLDVDAQEAMTRYAATTVTAVATPSAQSRVVEQGRRTRGTLVVSFALLVGFGLALFVVALYLQSGRPEVGTRHADLFGGRGERRVAPPAPAPPTDAAPAPPAAWPPPAGTVARPPRIASAPSAPAVPPSPSASARPAESAAAPAPPAPPPAAAPAPRATEPRPVAAATEPAPPSEASRTIAAAAVPMFRPGTIGSPYRLVARTLEATWLRVRTEDGRTMEETIPAGEIREWISNRPFVLTVGNAAGITLELNGQKLPPLGPRGVVIGHLVLPPPGP